MELFVNEREPPAPARVEHYGITVAFLTGKHVVQVVEMSGQTSNFQIRNDDHDDFSMG